VTKDGKRDGGRMFFKNGNTEDVTADLYSQTAKRPQPLCLCASNLLKITLKLIVVADLPVLDSR
jgi:hypothetical protein